jgi:transcription initiation factor TFIIH subunit 3
MLPPSRKQSQAPDFHATVKNTLDIFMSKQQQQQQQTQPEIKQQKVKVLPVMARGLTVALCHLNQLKKSHGNKGRIVVLQACADDSSQYIPSMNAVFTAKAMGIVIDALFVASDLPATIGDINNNSSSDSKMVNHSTSTTQSSFLQQATHLTGGQYLPLKVGLMPSLLQFLIQLFLPAPHMRDSLTLPRPTEVLDCRATCFCHNKTISKGVVCPVCLAVYCSRSTQCNTCGTRFALVKRGKK